MHSDLVNNTLQVFQFPSLGNRYLQAPDFSNIDSRDSRMDLSATSTLRLWEGRIKKVQRLDLKHVPKYTTDARISLDRQIFIAGFEEDIQQNPNQRNDPLAPQVYNFDLIPRYQWSDYVIIGRHFTFRNYEKRDAAIASLIKVKSHNYEFPESDSFEPWHRQWLGNSESPQKTHRALQRDGDKPSDTVSNEEGWRS